MTAANINNNYSNSLFVLRSSLVVNSLDWRVTNRRGILHNETQSGRERRRLRYCFYTHPFLGFKRQA